MSKELKIGLIATILILLLIWGINFLKGKNILSQKNHFYALYNEIGGLEQASPVYLNGYEVGMVENIKLTGKNMKDLLVTFTLRKDLKIPKNSKCIIYNADLMGTKAIKLKFTDAQKYFIPGDTIPSALEPNITEQIYTEIQPIKMKAQRILSALDTILLIFNEHTRNNIRHSIDGLQATTANLENTSKSLHALLSQNNQKINRIIHHTDEFTANLAKNNESISSTFSNLSAITDTLKKAKLNQTIGQLDNALASSDSLINEIRSGQGSLGRLATDDSLYIHFNQTTNSLNKLIEDIQHNPGKYIHISVFGKNK